MPNGDRDPLQAIYQLLLRQQNISEETNRLVDALVADVGRARDHGERIAILCSRIEHIEKSHVEWDRKRSECMASVSEQLKQIETRREAIKDRVSQLEQSMIRELSECKERIRVTIDQSITPVERIVSELREKVAMNAGKYGAIVALITSVLFMLLQWVISHPQALPKP